MVYGALRSACIASFQLASSGIRSWLVSIASLLGQYVK